MKSKFMILEAIRSIATQNRRLCAIALAALIGFSVVSCEDIEPVLLTGVSLNQTTLTIGIGDTATLTAVFAPTYASNKTVTWSSSAPAVATVNAGVVTGVSAGTATITVTTEDGGFTATCAVTVEEPPPPPGAAVYLAGSYNDEGTVTACYWKDGERKTLALPSGTNYSSASGIAVCANEVGEGGSVYITGYYRVSDDFTACYWEDEVRKNLDLPIGAGESYTDAIAVCANEVGEGGSVYIAGHYTTDGGLNTIGCYWKDGQRTDLVLPSGTNGIYAISAIAVSGDVVYIAGSYRNENWQTRACYWKNGQITSLDEYYSTSAIALSGDSVYVAGYVAEMYYSAAYYWKDTVKKALPSGEEDYSTTTAIALSGNSVYITGYYLKNDSFAACYWEDEIMTDLTFPADAVSSYALAIAISNGSVYIAGSYSDNNKTTACYWKDGVRTDLALEGHLSISDIAVVE